MHESARSCDSGKENLTGIYSIKNLINNKVYIGQSTQLEKRLSWHRQALNRNDHHNKHLQNSWNKYGSESFVFNIVCECSENELDGLEKYYIDLYHSTDIRFGYNEESGGCINKHHSERTKKKISEKTAGENNPMYGVHLTMPDDQRKKMSERMSGDKNPFYGKHHDEATRKKMSEKKKGIKWPIEVILSKGQNKRVRCLNNGMVFEALSLAAQWAGDTAPESISRVCYHKQKTAGTHPETGERLRWEFVELSHAA